VLLPYASDCRPKQFAVVTLVLLVGIALLSICTMAGGPIARSYSPHALLLTVGLTPAHFRPINLLTYTFFHDGWAHLLVNLLYLWVFGAGVEAAVGRKRFLFFYLSGGIVGGIFQILFSLRTLSPMEASQPIVGASAACACLVGLYAVRFYRARLAFVGLPYQPQVTLVVLLFLTLEMGLGVYALIVGAAADGVAHWAHIGGFVFGLTCGLLLRLDEAGSRAYLQSDAAVLLDRSDPGGAIRRYEALLAQDPNNADAHRDTARAWLQLDDNAAAADHFTEALRIRLARNERPEAARLFAEMRGSGIGAREIGAARPGTQSLRTLALGSPQLLTLGNALEEAGDFEMAADVLRTVTVHAPQAPEAEAALLRVALLYAGHLNRREEARILARLFQERYPESPFRARAYDLLRTLDTTGSQPSQ
jgi:membrane associated rhomboid family serine protease